MSLTQITSDPAAPRKADPQRIVILIRRSINHLNLHIRVFRLISIDHRLELGLESLSQVVTDNTCFSSDSPAPPELCPEPASAAFVLSSWLPCSCAGFPWHPTNAVQTMAPAANAAITRLFLMFISSSFPLEQFVVLSLAKGKLFGINDFRIGISFFQGFLFLCKMHILFSYPIIFLSLLEVLYKNLLLFRCGTGSEKWLSIS